MNKFTSYEHSATTFDYFFNKNHFLILLISLVVIIFFSMYAQRQRTKFQKGFVVIVGLIIVILEALRIYWRYGYLNYHNQSLDFLNVVGFDFFTLALWISIPLIFLGAAIKKKQLHNVFGLNFVFSITEIEKNASPGNTIKKKQKAGTNQLSAPFLLYCYAF